MSVCCVIISIVMIKLIASDVDGTLVEDGTFKLNPEYYSVIEKLYSKGIIFVASSGRQFQSIRSLFEPIAEKMAFISEGGAVVWRDFTPFVPHPLPHEYVSGIARDVREIDGADVMFGTPGYSLCPREGTSMYKWLKDGYRFKIKALDSWDIPDIYTFTKAAVYYPDRVEEVTYSSGFVKKWQKKLHLSLAGTMWLDCVMPNVNKGSALKIIMEDLGIAPDEVWGFGDNQNDLEMLELSGGGSFAVSSARMEVKLSASGIIGNYENDGVLTKLKELL